MQIYSTKQFKDQLREFPYMQFLVNFMDQAVKDTQKIVSCFLKWILK